MWQHHYLLHRVRMNALIAEAERERRWRRQDEANGRADGRQAGRPAGWIRAAVAGSLAAASRAAARLARRLDERVALDLGARPPRARRLSDASPGPGSRGQDPVGTG